MFTKTTVAHGFLIIEYPTDDVDSPIVCVGSNDSEDGGDNRVKIFTRDAAGQWWLTYVERNLDGEPFMASERTAGDPRMYCK